MEKKRTVAVFGTMDTKGEAYFYLKEQLEKRGVSVLMIDTGITPMPEWPCDITGDMVAAAGGSSLEEIKTRERLFSFEVMGKGSALLIKALCEQETIDGAVSMGGGQGTLLAAMVMKELQIGFPKLILSTIANLRTPPFDGVRDTVVLNSLVDVSGLNHVLKMSIRTAAAAMAGMVLGREKEEQEAPRKTVGITMFGVTTPCVERVQQILEEKGYEVIVFHANGAGGKMMESMIRDGLIGAVADITTGEVAQEYLGGTCTAGPHRLEAAPEKGIPQIICPGAAELANFMPPDTLPAKYAGYQSYMHNPNLKLLRAGAKEEAEIGRILAEKINRSVGPVKVLIPLKGFSLYSRPDGPIPDPEADAALVKSLTENLRADIPVIRMDCNINEEPFARYIAEELLKLY